MDWILIVVVASACFAGLKVLVEALQKSSAEVSEHNRHLAQQAAHHAHATQIAEAQASAAIQSASEVRAAELLAEFPDIADEGIAQLMRDELVNNRCHDHRYWAWATADTVGRMRRTILVTIARRKRESPRALRVCSCNHAVPDGVACPNCGASPR